MIGYLSSNHALIAAFAPRPVRRTRGETLAINRVFRSAPKLSDYFEEGEFLALKGTLDRPISGLAIDSRRVLPGQVFFAIPGLRADGATFIDEAMSRGATAIVTEKMPAHPPARVTFIHVAHARTALARAAQRFFKFPDRDLNVVGVTGTHGKTTVSHLLQHFLGGDQPVGLLGTVSYELGNRSVPSFHTTPESLDVYGMMAQMRDAGCRQAVVEVSSHGIDQQRVLGLQFGAVVFTNLTREHLDYHKSLATYFDVKTRLFTGETGATPKVAVINLDDPYGVQLTARIPVGVRTVTYGETSAAQVRAENVSLNFKNTTFTLVWPGGEMSVDAPIIGRFNLSNLLGAIAAAWSLGRDPFVFLARMRALKAVPGRMERIEAGQPYNVIVDYAHTEQTLRNTLAALRPLTPGRLLVVFGCPGSRDRARRPLMVGAVQGIADFAIATADNPRHETVSEIFADMQAGVTTPARITWIEDRRRAINLALDACKPGDTLLIAGRGHESYQELAGTVAPFDDRAVARELIAARLAAA